jgi:hypothetical protein
VGAEASYLTRLGIVFAYPIRLIIVRELYMREMSPPQFFEEFGGGSVDKVRLRRFKARSMLGQYCNKARWLSGSYDL